MIRVKIQRSSKLKEHEKKDASGNEIFAGKYEMDRLAHGLMEEDGEDKVLIAKPALDRLLNQYEDELDTELNLLEEDDDRRTILFCNKRGLYNLRQWLVKQSAFIAASKGNLTAKPK